jgi:uncharacterized heparinase superfamily protein
VDTTHPDGMVSLFNDGGLTMTYAPQECLRLYEALTGSRAAARGIFSLPAGGYFGVRERDSLLLVDCGAIGPDYLPAHGHGDILSFEWTLGGRRIVVDAGVFEYNSGPWRQYARSTAAHNTVTVGDEDQCEFWHAFRVGHRARASLHAFGEQAGGFTLEGSQDGYRRLPGAPVHHRRLTATAERIRAEDTVHGGAGQPVCARLLFHPDCRIEKTAGGARISLGGIGAVLRADGEIKIGSAWWCPDFGVRLPAPQIVIAYGKAPCAGAFTLEGES